MTLRYRNEGALTGARYLASLDDEREVWLDGSRIRPVQHPAFAGVLAELARIYDLQHSEKLCDSMTFRSPETGNRISYSYLAPRSISDLQAKRGNTQIWAEESWGQLARAPDFMANVAVGLYDFSDALGRSCPRFAGNAANYYQFCKENDLVLTHSIVDPQIDRSMTPVQDPDIALRVVRETTDGPIVRGAKQLATLAPLAHEILVYLSASYAQRGSKEFVIWFALPVATPGMRLLCRESFADHGREKRHPFASRYDEQDCMAFFDDVLVPWDRVFLLYDSELAGKGLKSINAWSLYASQIRFHARIETLIGVATLMAEAIGVDGFREIRERLGELITYGELVRLGLCGMEADARVTESGLLAPGSDLALSSFAGQISMRLVEIVREIGASGLLMQPSEADLVQPELRPFLDRYMRGHNIGVDEKSRLFRLAWDLVGDSWGMRQELYERWNRGDMARNRMNLYASYDRTKIVNRIRDLLSKPYCD
jgi:4-hydroxyphenylacetate 3-monooxygenase